MNPIPLRVTRTALDEFLGALLEAILAFGPRSSATTGANSECQAQLAGILDLLSDSYESTNWSALLAQLERWESAWQPLLIELNVRPPSSKLRIALGDAA